MNSSPTMAATMQHHPPPQQFSAEERVMTTRELREAARAQRNGPNSGHYRRQRASPTDEYRLSGEHDGPRTPSSDPVLQEALLAQAHNQRAIPVEQGGRQSAQRRKPQANATANRGNPNIAPQQQQQQQQQPPQQKPPFAGGPLDDMPGVIPQQQQMSTQQIQQQPNPASRQGQYRRQPARRGSEVDVSPAGAMSQQQTNSNSPQRQRPQSMMVDGTQQRRPVSPGAQSISGNSINRLNSPSIAQSVLQPLEKKIHEYDGLMQEAHGQMMQLDEELRALQERRRQAEERFLEAKGKHDDYERQHQDVDRALRGELPIPRPMSPPRPQHQAPMQRMPSVESFDERPMSHKSFTSGKPKNRGLRMSIFK